MPQTLSPEWRTELGPDAEASSLRKSARLCSRTLTLTGYNTELSNSPFLAKKELLAESHFVLNDWISAQEQWGVSQMDDRTTLLFEKARESRRVRSGRWKSISRYGLYVPLPLPERFARPTRIAVEALQTGVQRSFRIAAVEAGSFLAACDRSGSVPAAIIGADQRKVHLGIQRHGLGGRVRKELDGPTGNTAVVVIRQGAQGGGAVARERGTVHESQRARRRLSERLQIVEPMSGFRQEYLNMSSAATAGPTISPSRVRAAPAPSWAKRSPHNRVRVNSS